MISNFPLTPLNQCAVTAWMTSGHGFIQLECNHINETIGFYPAVSPDFEIGPKIFKSSGSTGMGIGSTGVTSGSNSVQSSKMSGSATYGKSKLLDVSSFSWKIMSYTSKAQLKDDTFLLSYCQISACAYSKLIISEKKANEIADTINRFSKITNTYSLIGNNCIDYMKKIMDLTANSSWKTAWNYTQPVSLYEKIIALSWRYFGLTI